MINLKFDFYKSADGRILSGWSSSFGNVMLQIIEVLWVFYIFRDWKELKTIFRIKNNQTGHSYHLVQFCFKIVWGFNQFTVAAKEVDF